MLLKRWECFWFLSSFEKIVRLQGYWLVQVFLVMASLFSMLNLAFEEGLGDKPPVFRVCLFLYALIMPSKTQNRNVLERELLHSWGSSWAFRKHFVKLFVGTFLYWFWWAHPSFWDHGFSKERAGLHPQAFIPSVSWACVLKRIPFLDWQPLS